MTMTLEQVRDWAANTPASNGWQAKVRDEAVAAIDAHLTQPAQSVDVAKVREVIVWLRSGSMAITANAGIAADKLEAALQEGEG